MTNISESLINTVMWDRFILLNDLLRAGYSVLESGYANNIAVGG